MKKDEVMAMSDLELNSMVWTMLYTEKPWKHWANADGTVTINGEKTSIADYATDMAAAWKLAEQADISVIRVGNEWWAGKFDGSNGDWWFDLGPIENTSAARAITQMFILAMAK